MNTNSIRKCPCAKWKKMEQYRCLGQIVDRGFLLSQTILLPVEGSVNAVFQQKR